ncbi:T9SS type A sorting domain-containing protein [Taibaiella soli]|uniref:Secretion system C-terminal sorting domain-containing protein n=1 Tax=Taibaiella soli TaxID=1649169 RepID=A0A2W2BA91_9BACT|nr:T9SS type A sorting domain-containing protein [Taibaiella soli]PZF72817.1 hypothetical protein DN068_10395 [Taibaiella soli]
MKRFFLALLILLISATNMYAQYFNVRDPFHSVATIVTSVVPYHDKYYCTGIALDSMNTFGNNQTWNRWGIKFAIFDNYGNKLKDTIYQRNDKFSFDSWSNNLKPMPGGRFLLMTESQDTATGANYTPYDFHSNLFVFDSLGHVLWQTEYNLPVSCAVFFNAVDFKPDSNGNWLLLSTISCNGGHNQMNLMKLDSGFHLLWNKQYGSNISDVATKILVDKDGGYILAGARNDVPLISKNFTAHALLIKTDTGGNKLWEYTSAYGQLTGAANDIIRTQDGGYLYCGTGNGYEYLSADGSSSQVMWRGWVEKMDSNRHVLWNHVFGFMNTNAGTNDQNVLRELPNKDIMIAGTIIAPIWLAGADTAGVANGSLIKMDANGNVLWQHKYQTPQTDTFFYFAIYDMKPTPDGGFIMVGQANDYRSIYGSPTQQGWIIKVDSNGCSGPNDPQCWPLAVSNTIKNCQDVTLYPNPVNDILQINSPLTSTATIQLTDITGKILLQQTLPKGHSEISLQSFPPSIFLYRIIGIDGYLQQGKLVKQ